MALRIGTPRPCKGCGKTILKLKFCTNECRTDWYARTLLERERARTGALPFRVRYPVVRTLERECVVCGEAFIRQQRPDDKTLCCSRECGFELIRQRGAVSRFITSEKRIFARWSKRAKAEPKLKKAFGKQCRECGTLIAKGAQRCEPCRLVAEHRSKTSEAAKAARRKAKAWRRAAERGADAERFDPFEIFDRDGWRCHLCGCRTPRSLRGTYQDRAPELDHIIPLSVGGKHTRANTACSCRKCNHAKGNRPLGQLRLAA